MAASGLRTTPPHGAILRPTVPSPTLMKNSFAVLAPPDSPPTIPDSTIVRAANNPRPAVADLTIERAADDPRPTEFPAIPDSTIVRTADDPRPAVADLTIVRAADDPRPAVAKTPPHTTRRLVSWQASMLPGQSRKYSMIPPDEFGIPCTSVLLRRIRSMTP